METYRDYYLGELYGTSAQKPPSHINMKAVTVYAGIIIGGAVIIASVKYFSDRKKEKTWKQHEEKWMAQSDKLISHFDKVLAGLKEKENTMATPDLYEEKKSQSPR